MNWYIYLSYFLNVSYWLSGSYYDFYLKMSELDFPVKTPRILYWQ